MTFTFEFAKATFLVSPLPNAYICDSYNKLWKGYKVMLHYFCPATEKKNNQTKWGSINSLPNDTAHPNKKLQSYSNHFRSAYENSLFGKKIKRTTFTVCNVKHIALKLCTLLLTLRLVRIGKSCLLFTIFLEIILKCCLVPLTYFFNINLIFQCTIFGLLW